MRWSSASKLGRAATSTPSAGAPGHSRARCRLRARWVEGGAPYQPAPGKLAPEKQIHIQSRTKCLHFFTGQIITLAGTGCAAANESLVRHTSSYLCRGGRARPSASIVMPSNPMPAHVQPSAPLPDAPDVQKDEVFPILDYADCFAEAQRAAQEAMSDNQRRHRMVEPSEAGANQIRF